MPDPTSPPDRAGENTAASRREQALARVAAFDDWLTTWRRADAAGQSTLVANGRELAAARRAALKELIQLDPQQALEHAVPVGLRPELPPEIARLLERRIDTRGDLEVTVSCIGAVTKLDRAVTVQGQRFDTFVFGRREAQHTKFGLPLHGIAIDEVFALAEMPYRVLDDTEKAEHRIAADLIGVTVGSTIMTLASPVELEELRQRLVEAEEQPGPYLRSGSPQPVDPGTPRAANTPWINGAKRVLWVKVDFNDDPGEFATDAQIDATNTAVSAFYAANSQGKTTMSFTILPALLRLPRDKSYYNASTNSVSELQSHARTLARDYDAANGNAGTYDPDKYDRWIVLFKRMPAYSFGGQAQLSGPQVRLNGTISAGTTAHELGHTQGLSHAHYWLPAGTSAVGAGAHVEYGDVFDNMGSSSSSPNNHWNTAQKAKLGYLDETAITTISEPGVYRIARHDHVDATGVRAVKVAPPGLNYDYWIEHRRYGPTSFNAAQMERLQGGAILHWGAGRTPAFTTGGGSYLVDATAGSAGGANDAPLRVGDSFVDPDGGVTIKPVATGGAAPNEYVEVQVAFGATGGNRNPTIQAELPAGPLAARTNIIFTARAADPDGDPVYYRWDFGDRQLSPNLDNITRRFMKGGTYSLRVSAHDGRGGIAAQSLTLDIADPLVSWTQRNSAANTNQLYDVTYGGGQFVAVGINWTVYTSPDAVTWSRQSFPTGISLTGVAHNGSRYVASGYRFSLATDRGIAAYSDDAITWTTVPLPTGTAQNLWGVTYGQGRFVIVGDGGTIFSSADGATWERAVSGITTSLRSVEFADGLFVASGESGRVLTSMDGRAWTNRSIPSSNTFMSATRHKGAWYVSSATTECYTSTDGVAWTRIGTAGRTNNTQHLISSGGLLFGATSNGSIAFAEDPRNWVTHQIDATPSTTFYGAVEGAGTLVLVGSRGLILTTSAPPPAPAAIAAPTLRNEADSLKVSVGKRNVLSASGAGFAKLELYANGAKVSELNGSAGALTWTPAAIGNYSLVLRGIDASGVSVVSSAVPAVAGLANWRWRNPMPVGADLNAAVRVNDRWWIVGRCGTFLTVDAGGVVTPLDFPTTQHLTDIAYANGRFVVTGPYFDAGAREDIGSIWTSTDGYSWTPLLTTVFDNFNLNFVDYAAGAWLVGSSGGMILTSTDGLSWTRQLSGVTNGLRGAAYGNNTWVVVGAAGRIITSPDGVRWTTQTSGVSTDLWDVAFYNGTFVAVGLSGTILRSTDGVTWARSTSPVSSSLSRVHAWNGAFHVVGNSGIWLTSANGESWTQGSVDGKFGDLFFVVGSGSQALIGGRMGELYSWHDGGWRRISQGTAESRLGVIYAGGRFVAVGQTQDPITRSAQVPVSVSNDGVTWSRANGNADFNNLNDVTHRQGLYVATGDAGRIFTSADALTWTRRSSDTTAQLNATAAGATGFIAAGANGAIVSSADGQTWSARSSGTTQPLRAATYGNGRYVVVGDGGTVLHSTDGATWSAATSTVTNHLLTIGWWEAYGFIAAGNSGTMIGSTDGVAWQQLETGVTDSLSAIALTPIGLVATGGTNGTLLLSLDGASWSVGTIPVDRAVRGIAASSSTIVAVGDNGSTLAFDLADSTPAPVITAAPASIASFSGGTATFTVAVRNGDGAVYQWYKDGTAIVGANTPSYTIASVSGAHLGRYTVSVTTATGTVTSTPAQLTFATSTDPGRLINLSILTALTSADDSFTFGVVVGGAGTTGTKPLLVRAAGPSLTPLGVDGALQDPKLEFFTGTTKVGENDNWGGGEATRAVMSQVGAFPFVAANSRDAALSLPSLARGANSAQISGTGAGTVLAELYDATPAGAFTSSTPRLINVSVLKHIGAGVTAGFVIGGSSPRTVLIRAIGPTLGAPPFGVEGAVADPQLALFRGESRLNSNDDWGGTTALTEAFTRVGAFPLSPISKDAALLIQLTPGSYTVEVSGRAGTGMALVEVYEVP